MEQLYLEQFEAQIHYHFKKRHLLVEALSHSSYANEKKKCRCSNERLEFLGDSVLSIVVSSYLFHQFPELPEGELTKLRASLVCEKALHVFAQEIHLGEYLLLGKGEEHTGGRTRSSILADAFEAVIAAIYLDGGFQSVTDVLLRRLGMENYIKKHADTYENTDYKTKLQESVNTNLTEINYEIYNTDGPAHDCTYYARVTITQKNTKNKNFAEGSGRSKKEAEQQAAKFLLKKIGII